jgi:hypothetical protein
MQEVTSQFQVISDVHLEHMSRSVSPDVQADAPYLIIAGDLGFPNQQTYWDFVRDASMKFKLVFLILGRHEYCSAEFTFVPKFVQDQILKGGLTNVIFLDNSTFDFAVETVDGPVSVRVLGSTLWSRIASPEAGIYRQMKVKTPNRYIDFDYVCNLAHMQCALWLDDEIARCDRDGRFAIVITHYLPSFKLIHSQYAFHADNAYYATDLDSLIRYPVIAWYFGRTHARGKVSIKTIPCFAGAVGYPGEAVPLYPPLDIAAEAESIIQPVIN